MRNKISLLVIGLILLATLLSSSANALIKDTAFFYEVTSVDNPSFWGWNIGDYIPGHAIYDDANIPATGSYGIVQPSAAGPNVSGSERCNYLPCEEQNWHVSIDLGYYIITESDNDPDNYRMLKFLNGDLHGFYAFYGDHSANILSSDWAFGASRQSDDGLGLHLAAWGHSGPSPSTYYSHALTGSFRLVPEPATMLLLGSGLFGLAVIGRKRFKK